MIRPVDYEPSQLYGDNPTKWLPADSWLIQTFGNYQPDGHTGIDYPCPAGTPVRAVAAGTVLHVGRLSGTYASNPWWISPGFAGFTYVVDHGSFIGIYGHCMDGGARVSKGQRVTEGQVLGKSGNTGASTGDHLHFEVLPDGYVLNSYMYGRINPATLFGSASITPQGEITPVQEDEMRDEQMFELKVFIQNELSRYLEAERGKLVRAVMDHTVDGVAGDRLSIGQFLSEYRSHVMQDQSVNATIAAGVAAKAAAGGASIEAIQKAVQDALAAGIKVEATVKVEGN